MTDTISIDVTPADSPRNPSHSNRVSEDLVSAGFQPVFQPFLKLGMLLSHLMNHRCGHVHLGHAREIQLLLH